MRLLVLGPLEVAEAGGEPLPIAGSKERTILACLVARVGRVVPVDDLIEELWGDHPPRAPEKTLVSYVSRLRRELQSGRAAGSNVDVIVFRADGYTLESDGHEIDAISFEQLAVEGHRLLATGRTSEADPVLQEALGLWRGTAYQGYRYTRFGATEGERLDELRRTATEDLVDSRLAGADPGQLIPKLEAMVREEPLRERRWGQLMVALYRAERQGEALRAFARAREVLVGELGIEPGPEMQRLEAAILSHDPELERGQLPRAEPVRSTDVCPYKGLARFETADAEFFFGREQVIAEAIGRLVEGRFLALVGPSGSGKSSLLRAGLMHALGSGALPGSDRWAYSVIRPGNHPLDALVHALKERREHSVLAVDQFEEVFTECSDVGERTGFLDAITEAAAAPDGATTIVMAMRADFYGRCAEHRTFASLLASGQILVGPMDPEELRRAIERPAQRAGLTVEEELVDSLVSDTVGQPGGLPLLSTALLELWTQRRDRTLRLNDHLRAGGVEGAVARLAEDAFGRLDGDAQSVAKRILLRLAAPGVGADVVRRRAPLSEFDLDRDANASRAMAVLTDARLVTVAEGTAEVAHEALLHEWPRLRTWLEEDAEGRKLHRHITESTHAWDEGGHDLADLYRGARLTAAWEWAESKKADLNDLEREFLRASRAASEGEASRARRTNRRLRRLLVGVAVLLAASLVIGDIALTQRDRATGALTLADAGRLASGSRLEADPQLALLMAREAVHINDSPETRSALFAALERTPAITDRIYAPGGPSPGGDERQWIAISRDGSALAIGDTGPTVEFIDPVHRVPIGAVDVGSGTERAEFSPDGKTLAVVTSAGDLVPVDVAARTVRDSVRVPAGASIDAMAFDPSGGKLLTAEHGADMREFLVPRDPITLQPIGRRVPTPGRDRAVFPQISPPLSIFAMAFAPDGSGLVTTRDNGPTLLWDSGLTTVRRYAIGGQDVAVSPDGSIAALIGNSDRHTEGKVSFLNLRTGDVRTGSGGHHGPFKTEYEAVGVTFTPDGRSVVTVGNDSRLLIWDVATASVSTALAETGDLPLRGPVLSADGTTAYTTDRNRDVVIWDLSGRHRLDRPFTGGTGFPGWPWFAMSPDGRTIAVISLPKSDFGKGGTIALVDTANLHVVRRIRYAHSTPEALAFSPDASTLAVGDDVRSEARLWDVASGKMTAVLHAVPAHQRLVAMEFSPDGSMLVGGTGPVHRGLVFVWRPETPKQGADLFRTPGTVEDLTFTPDGSQLVLSTGWGDGGDFVLWDAATQRIVKIVHADDAGVWTADVSGDGRTLMTGGQTGIVRLWDLATGKPLGAPLASLTGGTDTVDLSPDGSTAVSADTAGTVRLWDVPTRSTIGDPFPGPVADRLAAASFTPDGRSVVVVSDTGAGWVWDVDPSDWLVRACEIAGRSLTPQEWQEFLPDRPYHATCGS